MKKAIGPHRRKEARSNDPERLAPPEEEGACGIAGPKVKIAADLMSEADDDRGLFRVDPIVLAILGAAIAFIAFIAWEIHRTPGP